MGVEGESKEVAESQGARALRLPVLQIRLRPLQHGRHPVIETRLLRFARARDVEPSDVMLVEKRDQLVRNAENAENAENAVMQVLGLTGQCAIPVGSVDINLLYVRVFSMGRALRFFAEGVSSMMDISAPSFETVVSLSPNVYYLRAANDISKAFSKTKHDEEKNKSREAPEQLLLFSDTSSVGARR